MKKLLISLLTVLIFTACKSDKKDAEKLRYTQDSEEINTFKSTIDHYVNANWEAMKRNYADTAQIFHNSNQPLSIDRIINRHQEMLSGLTNYGFTGEDDEYEMVLTDDGHTWVNFWGDWRARLPGSDTDVIVPVHLTARFDKGKIVKEHGYWDNSIMMSALQKMDTSGTARDSIQSP